MYRCLEFGTESLELLAKKIRLNETEEAALKEVSN